MRKLFKFLLLVILLNSCNEEKLDYSKIDFETRKIMMDSWNNYDDLKIERIGKTEKKKYQYYEKEIKVYKKKYTSNLDYSDSIKNYPEILLSNLKEQQNKRKSVDDPLLDFSSPEEELDFWKGLNDYDLEENKKVLDSLQQLYKKVNKNDKYYKLEYVITYNLENADTTETQNLAILVDENSEIFDYQFLGLSQNRE
ncbi:hypothetical protein [Christiangramia sp.]|uniref:hypothetical protein n=1 Tax=Christiangramia sp. TaxID=1931228 RepID=UPI00262A9E2C|nr:hypothetical protein [Christiangramia sp.]